MVIMRAHRAHSLPQNEVSRALVVSISDYYGTETACYITVLVANFKWNFLPFSLLLDCINVQEQFICSLSSLIRLSAPLITNIFMKLEKCCWGAADIVWFHQSLGSVTPFKKPEVSILPCLWRILRGCWTNYRQPLKGKWRHEVSR